METGEPPELTQGLHVERQLEARFTRKMVCLFPRTVCTLPQNPHMMYILASETRIKGLVPLADLAMASFQVKEQISQIQTTSRCSRVLSLDLAALAPGVPVPLGGRDSINPSRSHPPSIQAGPSWTGSILTFLGRGHYFSS